MDKSDGACFKGECYCKDSEDKRDWNYEDQEDWPNKYPKCGGDKRQSPKKLQSSQFTIDSTFIERLDYSRNLTVIMENTGYGARLYVQSVDGELPRLNVKYSEVELEYGEWFLGYIDLHWGTSEHSIDGKRANMEAQFFHFHEKIFHIDEAAQAENGILALAVLSEVSQDETDWCEMIFKVCSKVKSPNNVGATVMHIGTHFKMLDMALGDTTYAEYEGSQTSPPCDENVVWLVAKDIVKVKASQIEAVQTLEDANGDPILANSRDLKQ